MQDEISAGEASIGRRVRVYHIFVHGKIAYAFILVSKINKDIFSEPVNPP